MRRSGGAGSGTGSGAGGFGAGLDWGGGSTRGGGFGSGSGAGGGGWAGGGTTGGVGWAGGWRRRAPSLEGGIRQVIGDEGEEGDLLAGFLGGGKPRTHHEHDEQHGVRDEGGGEAFAFEPVHRGLDGSVASEILVMWLRRRRSISG
jgi:hypothetical protein